MRADGQGLWRRADGLGLRQRADSPQLCQRADSPQLCQRADSPRLRLRLLTVWLALTGLPGMALAGESWRTVFENAALRVDVDTGSLRSDKNMALFRERHRLAAGEIDPESLRHIVEIQIRRQADCRKRRLAVLSRAAFSDQDALVRYEAFRIEKLKWQSPAAEWEMRIYETVCGRG